MDDVNVPPDETFEEFFRSQYPRLVSFGLAWSGDVELARDIAQEAMARTHRRWEMVTGLDSPEAWVMRVMKNLLIDHHRRRTVEAAAVQQLSARPHAGDAADSGMSLADLVRTLPARQCAVVALVYGADLSVAQAADVLEIAQGTVKATLWQARRSLARQLTKETTDD